jgi:hypothetical protein
MTPPPWPFKGRRGEEGPKQEVINYTADASKPPEVLADRSHLEANSFQDAMAKLSQPHLGSPLAGVPSQSEVDTPVGDSASADGGYVQNQDGYYYRMNPDGSWDSTAYVKQQDGSFSAYQA